MESRSHVTSKFNFIMAGILSSQGDECIMSNVCNVYISLYTNKRLHGKYEFVNHVFPDLGVCRAFSASVRWNVLRSYSIKN